MKTKPFNLEEYLASPSQKVVTRDGRYVRIICWDAKNSKPIVALVLTRSISQREFDELTVSYFNDGTYYGRATEDPLDLFFADEEEKFTEFEQAVRGICKNLRKGIDDVNDIHVISNNLLDLARKQLQPEIDRAYKTQDEVVYQKGYNEGYKAGMEVWRPKLYQTIASIPCYAPDGICTNPQMDCINCPKLFSGKSNITTTLFTDGKEHQPSFIE